MSLWIILQNIPPLLNIFVNNHIFGIIAENVHMSTDIIQIFLFLVSLSAPKIQPALSNVTMSLDYYDKTPTSP